MFMRKNSNIIASECISSQKMLLAITNDMHSLIVTVENNLKFDKYCLKHTIYLSK